MALRLASRIDATAWPSSGVMSPAPTASATGLSEQHHGLPPRKTRGKREGFNHLGVAISVPMRQITDKSVIPANGRLSTF